MAKPQQPELHRSGLTPTDPASVKTRRGAGGRRPETTDGGTGPVPEENTPGHHPEVEQDKPVARFTERAMSRAREATPAQESSGAEATPSEVGDSDGTSAHRPSLWDLVPGLAVWDAWRRPASAWSAIGENRSAWLARLVFLPTVAPWRYSTKVKPRLQEATAPRS